MSEVLILGNGISRLSFDAEIRAWSGELWGCNDVYRRQHLLGRPHLPEPEYIDVWARVRLARLA